MFLSITDSIESRDYTFFVSLPFFGVDVKVFIESHCEKLAFFGSIDSHFILREEFSRFERFCDDSGTFDLVDSERDKGFVYSFDSSNDSFCIDAAFVYDLFVSKFGSSLTCSSLIFGDGDGFGSLYSFFVDTFFRSLLIRFSRDSGPVLFTNSRKFVVLPPDTPFVHVSQAFFGQTLVRFDECNAPDVDAFFFRFSIYEDSILDNIDRSLLDQYEVLLDLYRSYSPNERSSFFYIHDPRKMTLGEISETI